MPCCCHAVRCAARAVCCSCESLGAAVGGALFGAWLKWGGGKEGALGVLKDTNGSGQRGSGSSGAGAMGAAARNGGGHGGGIGAAAAALL
jgi:hypothetical protein